MAIPEGSIHDDDCAFCQIAQGKAPATMHGRGANWIAIEPLSPHAPGHLLFMPTAHYENAADRPGPASSVFRAAAEFVRDQLGGKANILTSCGEEATQTVFHYHVHVIPRGEEDGLARDWPWMRPEKLEEDA